MPYGQGSITPQKKRDPVTGEMVETGRYLARYYGPDGKQRSKTFTRKTDARAFMAAMQTDKMRGTWIDPNGGQVFFGAWAEKWFESKHSLGAHARDRDGGLLRNHILPALGDIQLGRVGPLDLRLMVDELYLKKRLSPSTVSACYRIAISILRSAAEMKLIAEVPSGRGVVNLPKINRKRERHLTEPEVERLADSIHEHYRPLIYTLAYTGCRWQELAGLKRCYLDLKGERVHVRGVLVRTERGRYEYQEFGKTHAAWRTIGLPSFLIPMLEPLAENDETEWVFTGPKGARLDGTNFSRPFKKAAAAAGLLPLSPHDLRHTQASWLIRDGMQLLALTRRMGHASSRTTLDVYGHLFENFDQEAVVRLDERRRAAHSEGAKIIPLAGRS